MLTKQKEDGKLSEQNFYDIDFDKLLEIQEKLTQVQSEPVIRSTFTCGEAIALRQACYQATVEHSEAYARFNAANAAYASAQVDLGSAILADPNDPSTLMGNNDIHAARQRVQQALAERNAAENDMKIALNHMKAANAAYKAHTGGCLECKKKSR